MQNAQDVRATLHQLNELRTRYKSVRPECVPPEDRQAMLNLASNVEVSLRQMRRTFDELAPVNRFIFVMSM